MTKMCHCFYLFCRLAMDHSKSSIVDIELFDLYDCQCNIPDLYSICQFGLPMRMPHIV